MEIIRLSWEIRSLTIYRLWKLKSKFSFVFYFAKTDATRRAASTMARHSAAQASYKSQARKSIGIPNEEEGFQRMDDNDTTSRTAGVRFEVNDKQVETEENRTQRQTFLIEDTSFLQVSAQSEDEEHKPTDSECTTLDESFDSAL